MARWHRLTTYTLLALCALSGLAWFVGLDLLDLPPPRLRLCWVLHGITALAATLAIGAAVPQHALMTWRAHRNRAAGAVLGTTLALVVLSALCLQYGLEDWHDAGHWVHVAVGIAVGIVFPWHIWWARSRS